MRQLPLSREMEHGGRIRIVIADDHTILGQGVRTLLQSQPDFDLVGDATDAGGAVAVCARLMPDILLLDLLTPADDGLDALASLGQLAPSVRVILMTGAIDSHELVTALALGARGVLLKDSATSILFTCIRTVAANHYWIGRSAVVRPAEALQKAGGPATSPGQARTR